MNVPVYATLSATSCVKVLVYAGIKLLDPSVHKPSPIVVIVLFLFGLYLLRLLPTALVSICTFVLVKQVK